MPRRHCACDVQHFDAGMVIVDQSAFGFPIPKLKDLPSGDYYVQALFDHARELRLPNAPDNCYSSIRRVHLEPSRANRPPRIGGADPLGLRSPNTGEIHYLRVPSKLLSDFHHRPMFLRAGVCSRVIMIKNQSAGIRCGYE